MEWPEKCNERPETHKKPPETLREWTENEHEQPELGI